MKGNVSGKLSGFYWAAMTIAAIGIAAAGPALHATPKSDKAADKPANVVAHVQLSSGPVTRMLLVKKNGKEYLLLGLDSRQASPSWTLVTLTSPVRSIQLRELLERRPPK
jgi:hypothetical protein